MTALLNNPAAFLWLLAAAAVLITGGSFAAALHRGKENIDLRVEVERLEAELAAAYESLSDVLDEHALCPAPVRHLRAVPTQRTGHEPWPLVARAVETFMDAVERWGTEA